jgi:hypothetical protein
MNFISINAAKHALRQGFILIATTADLFEFFEHNFKPKEACRNCRQRQGQQTERANATSPRSLGCESLFTRSVPEQLGLARLGSRYLGPSCLVSGPDHHLTSDLGVYEDTDSYCCVKRGEGGDQLALILAARHCDSREALAFMADESAVLSRQPPSRRSKPAIIAMGRH